MKTSDSTILSVVLITLLISSMTFAVSPVRNPVLYFNPVETRQQQGDNAWRNAGTAGGQLEKGRGKPVLEHGPIEIPAIGIKSDNAAWYTATQSNTVFANEEEDENPPIVHLQDFTIGLLMRINGTLFMEEHQVFGIQTQPWDPIKDGWNAGAPRDQIVRAWLDATGSGIFQNISFAQNVVQHRQDLAKRKNKLNIGQNEWHWVHLVFASGESITIYRDGVEVSNNPSEVEWDPAHDMLQHGIFTSAHVEQQRTCNCSIAIYRVYDRALSTDEINKNVRNSLSVDPAGKLAVTWGKMKRGF
jgi:hypothetical protein